MKNKTNILIWNEFRHEKNNEAVKAIYPEGIHHTIAESLRSHSDINVSLASLDEPEHGLTDEVLDQTDVLFWWGHCAHGEVRDDIIEKVQQRILEGMGLVVLHSGHYSKIFRRMMGTNCSLKWREFAETERVWNIEPAHPITQGIDEYFELPHAEMYGERFDIPTPDKLIFISWFEGGEVFRSGCCWERGHGRIFYFRPGHETYPIYHNENVQRILLNAARWAKPRISQSTEDCPNSLPIESIEDQSPMFGLACIPGQ